MSWLRCPRSMVANFLAEMNHTGLEYWALNTCRSEISANRNSGEPLVKEKQPLVATLMNNIGNLYRIKVSKPRSKLENRH